MTRPTPRRTAGKPTNAHRSGGAEETDPTAGGAIVGNCGRKADEPCGMTDPSECSVHAGAELDLDSEEAKRLAGLLARLLPRRKEGGEPADDLPVAHEDAIRVAHKCLRTSKAFLTEAVSQHSKAIDLLGGVVDALDAADPISTTAPDTDPDAPDGDKAAQLLRAAAEKRRLAGT